MPDPYADTREYLRDVFVMTALRLHHEVERVRMLRGPGTDEAFLGLFLSDEEVDTTLAALSRVTVHGSTLSASLAEEMSARTGRIEERLAATPEPMRPRQLAEFFGLPHEAVEIVLLLLAAEVDGRFAKVYAYLHDDVTRRWLSPGLALRLLPGTAADDSASRALFAPESPLIRERLVRVCTSGNDAPPAPLIDRPLKLDDRIVEYLLENDAIDVNLEGVVSMQESRRLLDDVPLDSATLSQLRHLADLWTTPEAPAAFFWGRAGSGKAAAAAAIACELGRPLLALDSEALARRPTESVPTLLQLAIREARLRQAVLHLHDLDTLDEAARAAVLERVQPGLILSARTAWSFHERPKAPVVVPFPVPGYTLRKQLWHDVLVGEARLNGPLPGELAGRFRLTPGQITRAARVARQRAWLRDGPNASPVQSDLFEGCRLQSNPALDRLAQKVTSPYDWDDLVLPSAQRGLLRAVESQFRHSHRVYQQWGFEAKVPQGKGVNALFSGPSGTGKTMAAGILAKSLGLDLYKIDLSGVVSKYIGETEKNLSRIFEEASTANAVLFFDEADALFGKRSEVKDAHDRYANIEVSYLLQKMEEYEGMAILATNFSQNLDEAFTRRMQYVVEFPCPQAEDRERIWRGLFPDVAPRAGDVDFGFLAQQFDLTGGHIKNCVVAGAFLAAEEGVPIGMHHLIQGVVRELGKLGRTLKRTDFGGYYTIVRRSR